MGRQPAFVVEDQSEVIAFLEARLSPVERIDTHGAVVFLARERAYKLKRAVKFPYMDFSTVERRAAMCAAEIDINRRLAPEIYLGTAAVWRGRDGKLALGEVGERAQRHRLAGRHASLRRGRDARSHGRARRPDAGAHDRVGPRVARFHDGLAPIKSGFCMPDDYRHSVSADVRQMREAGDRLDPSTSEALADAMPKALEPYLELVARRVTAGAVRRGHGDLHLRNIVVLNGEPVPFDAIEFSEKIANIDVLYDLAFTLMDLARQGLGALANRLLNEWLWRIAELPEAPHEEAWRCCRCSCRGGRQFAPMSIRPSRRSAARTMRRRAPTRRPRWHSCSRRRRACWRLAGCRAAARPRSRSSWRRTSAASPGAVVVRSDVERKRRAGIALEARMPAGSLLRRRPRSRGPMPPSWPVPSASCGPVTAWCWMRCSPAPKSAPRPRHSPPSGGRL